MADKPIIFSPPMVRAILEGRKTQTRRVVRTQPPGAPKGAAVSKNGWLTYFTGPSGSEYASGGACRYGKPGDLLWVRERWCERIEFDDFSPRDIPHSAGASVWYFATDEEYCATHPEPGRWRRSFHMPRWASRLTLRLTDVRVERVQDISGYDAYWEGVCDGPGHEGEASGYTIEKFRRLWDSINAKRGFDWEQNPWVWTLTFQVIHKNVDAVIKEQP